MNTITYDAIRRAQPGDLDRLRGLAAVATRELCLGDYTPQQIETALSFAGGGIDPQVVADGNYYVLERDARIIAGGGWSRRPGMVGADDSAVGAAATWLDPARGDAARIRGFFVHPDFARRGLGSALLDLCERGAVHAGFRRVELMATLTGRRLYLSRGYEDERQMTTTFPNGVRFTGYRMCKHLAPHHVTVEPAADWECCAEWGRDDYFAASAFGNSGVLAATL